jgi:hypothetical protein
MGRASHQDKVFRLGDCETGSSMGRSDDSQMRHTEPQDALWIRIRRQLLLDRYFSGPVHDLDFAIRISRPSISHDYKWVTMRPAFVGCQPCEIALNP